MTFIGVTLLHTHNYATNIAHRQKTASKLVTATISFFHNHKVFTAKIYCNNKIFTIKPISEMLKLGWADMYDTLHHVLSKYKEFL